MLKKNKLECFTIANISTQAYHVCIAYSNILGAYQQGASLGWTQAYMLKKEVQEYVDGQHNGFKHLSDSVMFELVDARVYLSKVPCNKLLAD